MKTASTSAKSWILSALLNLLLQNLSCWGAAQSSQRPRHWDVNKVNSRQCWALRRCFVPGLQLLARLVVRPIWWQASRRVLPWGSEVNGYHRNQQHRRMFWCWMQGLFCWESFLGVRVVGRQPAFFHFLRPYLHPWLRFLTTRNFK